MEYQVQRDGDVWRLRLQDEVRTGDHTALESALNNVLADGAMKVVVDLENVGFLASSLIGVLLETSSCLTAKGGSRIVLFRAARRIKDVISLLFPPERFFIYADSDEEIKKAFLH